MYLDAVLAEKSVKIVDLPKLVFFAVVYLSAHFSGKHPSEPD